MEAVVPAEITSELTQILSNLVLGDNDIRSRYTIHYTCPLAALGHSKRLIQRRESCQ